MQLHHVPPPGQPILEPAIPVSQRSPCAVDLPVLHISHRRERQDVALVSGFLH